MKTKLIVLAMLFVGVVSGQVGPDQPYMLVYRMEICPNPYVINASPAYAGSAILQNSTSGTTSTWTCPKQIQVEYFPSRDAAIERLNTRGPFLTGTATIFIMPPPMIASEDVIGLFKVQRIPVSLKPSGKKQKVTRQVPQEFEEDVFEWRP